MGTVTYIKDHFAKPARADGVRLAVACTAQRLGLSPQQVIRCAQVAHDRMMAGKASAASVYADAKAKITAAVPAVTA